MARVTLCDGNARIVPLPPLNQCSNEIGDQYAYPNWVSTISGQDNLGFINSFSGGCQLMGPEWEYTGAGSPTGAPGVVVKGTYNGINYPINVGDWESCMGPSGTNVQSGLVCTRQSFQGDPTACCLGDYICNQEYNNCFSNSGKLTCDPTYRSQISSPCDTYMNQFCSGNSDLSLYNSTGPYSGPDAYWMNEWTPTGRCTSYLKRKLFWDVDPLVCQTPDPVATNIGSCNYSYDIPYSGTGFFVAQELMRSVLEKYTSSYKLGENQAFNQQLYQTCCSYPGLCSVGLNQVCSSVNLTELKNETLGRWCGCHMNSNYYDYYSEQYNIDKECTPMCTRYGTIREIDNTSNLAKECDSSVCIIDNVTLNMINSSASGIQFNQLCSGCTDSNCSCIVSGASVDVTNSTIGGYVIPVTQGCGQLSCNAPNSSSVGPSLITTDCSNTNNGLSGFYSKWEKALGVDNTVSVIINIILVLLIIIGVVILGFIITKSIKG